MPVASLIVMRRRSARPHPRLTGLGRSLPGDLRRLVRRAAQRPGISGLLADLFLSYPPDPWGLDPVRAKRSFFLVEQTIGRYFRLETLDAHHLPTGRALVIGCHSGVLPWDAACLVTAIRRESGRFSRNVGHELFGAIGPVERYLTARGVAIGRYGLLRELLEHEEIVLLFPGGAEDMRRPFWERYRVKPHKGFAPGRGGYVKLALETRSPIVPVAVVGAEETHWLLTDFPVLARLTRAPFFPIVLSPVPLPAKIYVRFGEPVVLDEPPEAARDQRVVDRLNDAVRGRLQALIDDTVGRRRGIFWSSWDGAAPAGPGDARTTRRRTVRRSSGGNGRSGRRVPEDALRRGDARGRGRQTSGAGEDAP